VQVQSKCPGETSFIGTYIAMKYMRLRMNENVSEPHGKAKINEIFKNMFYANLFLMYTWGSDYTTTPFTLIYSENNLHQF
jgi:hypothetical protein